MLRERALHDRSDIERRLEITPFIQGRRRQPRPVADDSTTLYGATEQKRGRASSVIGAPRTVDGSRTAKLGRDEHRGVLPDGAKLLLQRSQARIERSQSRSELALRPALVGVRVPAGRIEDCDLRAIVPAQ